MALVLIFKIVIVGVMFYGFYWDYRRRRQRRNGKSGPPDNKWG